MSLTIHKNDTHFGMAHFIGADFVVDNEALNNLNNQYRLVEKLSKKFPNYFDQYMSKKPLADCLNTDTNVFSIVLADNINTAVSYTPLAMALQELRDQCVINRIDHIDIYLDGLNIHEGNLSCIIRAPMVQDCFDQAELTLKVPYSVKNAIEYAFADTGIDVRTFKQNTIVE